MKAEDFIPVSSPVMKGINLIEASAGTGKTYAIAMLVLRLVVELDVAIGKILVVTFTKAATEELKDRVRRRLKEAKKLLSNQPEDTDDTLKIWLEQLNMPPGIILQRLNLALLDIDQAAIFTIHAFCQRVLNEHALTSGQLFDAGLTGDLAAIRQACADDFWRLNIQNRTPWEVAALTKDFKTPDELLKSVGSVTEDAVVRPENGSLDEALSRLKQLAGQAREKLADVAEAVAENFSGQHFKTGYQAAFSDHCTVLGEWLQNNSLQFPDDETLSFITYQGLYDSLNGNKFRSSQAQAKTPEERKAEFLAELKIDTKPFDDLAVKSREISILLRRNLLEYLRMELDKRLEQINAWSFDSLISHLSGALHNDQAGQLVDELRQRYTAALIDEFQDTDDRQWHIFSTIFAASSHYLMLVGDPKQAIYKFRGADIYSYLAAQKQAQQQFTLRRNWRSHPDLVAGVNRLFQRDDVFLLPDINFKASEAALSAGSGALFHEGKGAVPLMLWQLPQSESKTGFWQTNQNDAAELIAVAVVNEIVSLLTGDYTLQPQNRRPVPQDIAILVRTNKQARDYQDALRSAGVPSVLTSTEPVFGTEEAFNLYKLLAAVANPGNSGMLGQALALDWFGHNGAEIYRILNSEQELDRYVSRFSAYYQLWLEKGLMTMMQALLPDEKVTTVLAATEGAERRLTNLQHLLEFLQQAAIDGNLDIHKTLSRLKNEITLAQAGNGSAENQQLRLESDADAVKIITMHRAKGLEFPVVFCPHLWQSKTGSKLQNQVVICHLPDPEQPGDFRTIADLGSPEYEMHSEQAQSEARAEDIRLAYVALTRAKYRCYIAWADSRTATEANASALAWLLDLGSNTFQGQQELLQELARRSPESFAYRLLEKSPEVNHGYKASARPSILQAKKRRRPLYTGWRMSSYTALSELSTAEVPELPGDKAGEKELIADGISESLPAGARTGNVIHELLENISFQDLAVKGDISALRDKACQHYGLRLEKPEIIDDLLYKTVNTPLSETDAVFCLKNIPGSRCLKEMPFYLGLSSFNTGEINRILRDQGAFQDLSHQRISGYLTGFIDLVCEFQGCYYVMDYKTNALPDYQPGALIQAMKNHNYGLQYWLYCVVLHRYLKNRLPGYDYERHFGGVRYLFVRGMEPAVPMSGVFHDLPGFGLIEALSALFHG